MSGFGCCLLLSVRKKGLVSLLKAPWWGVKVPRGHKISLRVPAGQYLPLAQGRPGPTEPGRGTMQREIKVMGMCMCCVSVCVCVRRALASSAHPSKESSEFQSPRERAVASACWRGEWGVQGRVGTELQL